MAIVSGELRLFFIALLVAASVGCGPSQGTPDGGGMDGGTGCPGAEVSCGSICVDTSANLDHCGACDAACANGWFCVAGTCEPPLLLTTHQAANVVLGQPDFDTAVAGTTATSMDRPVDAYVQGGRLFIADRDNSRVLAYNSVPTTNGAAADNVFGQATFATNTAATTASGLDLAAAVAVNATGGFFVADQNNNRIVFRTSAPAVDGANADLAIGQPNLTASGAACTNSGLDRPKAVFAVGDKVIIADSANDRVLIWNSIPASDGVAADLVLGQVNFDTCGPNRNAGSAGVDTLNDPRGIWSDGTRLIVADTGNDRVLIWTSFPTSNGVGANVVIGQPDFTTIGNNLTQTGLSFPTGVASNGTQLAVSDANGNRVMIWNSFPTSNGAPADVVLGQNSFTTNATATSVTGLASPEGLFMSEQQLIVADRLNERVLIYNGQ